MPKKFDEICIMGLNPYNSCGAAAYCSKDTECCMFCDTECNARCWYADQLIKGGEVNDTDGFTTD